MEVDLPGLEQGPQVRIAFATVKFASGVRVPEAIGGLASEVTEMKRLFAYSLLGLLLSAVAVAPALAAGSVTESDLMQAATELGRQYDANYNAKNPAGMAALYAPDGLFLSPSGLGVRGREALKSYYAGRFATGAGSHAIKVAEVHVQGDGGYGVANFSVDAPRANGDHHEVKGRLVAIYERDADGWRMRLLEASILPEPAKK